LSDVKGKREIKTVNVFPHKILFKKSENEEARESASKLKQKQLTPLVTGLV